MTYSNDPADQARSAAMTDADITNGESPTRLRCAVVAVDETIEAINTARTALRLLGPDVRYVLVNVGKPEPIPWTSDPMMWGVMPPQMVTIDGGYTAHLTPPAGDDPVDEATEAATAKASTVAASAGIPGAEPIGTTGESTADAIRAVADDEGADVIVVGTRHRSWLSRLLGTSVTSDVLRDADRPVLVVP